MPNYTVIKRGKPIRNEKGEVTGFEKGKSRQVTTNPNRRQTITGGGSVINRSTRTYNKNGKLTIGAKSKNQQLLEAGKKDQEILERERQKAINNRSFKEKKAGFLAEVQKVKDNDFVNKRIEQKAYNKLENKKNYKKRILYPAVSEVKQGAGIQARSSEYEKIEEYKSTPSGVYGINTIKGVGRLESKIQAKEVEAIKYNIQGNAFKEFKTNTDIFFLQGAKDIVGVYDFVRKPSKKSGFSALENLGAGFDDSRLHAGRFSFSLALQLGLEGIGGGLKAEKISSDLANVVKVGDSVYIPKTGAFKVESGGKFVQLTSKNLGKTIVEETSYLTYLDEGQKTSQLLKVESKFFGELGKGKGTQFTTGKGVSQLTDMQGNVLKNFDFTTKAQFQNKLGKIGLRNGAVGTSKTSLFEILPSKSVVLGDSTRFNGFVRKLRTSSTEDILSIFNKAETKPAIVKKGFGIKNIERTTDKNFLSISSDIYDFDTKIFKQSQKSEEIFKIKIKDQLHINDLGFKGTDFKFVKGGDVTGGVFKNQEIFNVKQVNNVFQQQQKISKVGGAKLRLPKVKGAFLGKKAQSGFGLSKTTTKSESIISSSNEVGSIIQKTLPKIKQVNKQKNILTSQPSVAGMISQSIGKSVYKLQGLGLGIGAGIKEKEKFSQVNINLLSGKNIIEKELNKELKTPIKSNGIEAFTIRKIDYLNKMNVGKKSKADNIFKKVTSQEIAQKIVQKNKQTTRSIPLLKNIPRTVPKPKKTPFVPPFILPSFSLNKSSRRNGGNFGALVKVGGKWRIVGQQNVSLRKASRIGSRYVQRTSSASFKIVDLSSGGFAKLPSIALPRGFKKGKGDKESFVEKNKFRIDTGGEFKGITIKGINTKKLKGLKL